MTDDELNEIEARANAATPGPWEMVSRSGGDDPYLGFDVEPLEQSWLGRGMLAWKYDADFIAHAREDVPALIADVRRLRAEQKEAQP